MFGRHSNPSTLFFVGQDEALEKLYNAITSCNIILVGGIAGIGKTYLVAHFAEKLQREYAILWQDLTSASNPEQILLSIAEFLKISFEDEILWEALRNPTLNEVQKLTIAANSLDKHGCLVVWDNFDLDSNLGLVPLVLTLNRVLRIGRLIVTTREFFELGDAFNPIFRFTVQPMVQDVGVVLMRHYMNKLGLPRQSNEVLVEAFHRVSGHPYFMSRLVFLGESFDMNDLVNALPQFTIEAYNYIQQRILSQLSPSARGLLRNLSNIRKPFKISAIDFSIPDARSAFNELQKRFIVTRQSQGSEYYGIHDLVREFEISQMSEEDIKIAHGKAADYYHNLARKSYSDVLELVLHRIEAGDYSRAEEAANGLLGSALRDGLFDLVIDTTNQIIARNLPFSLGMIYFSRGRAFRLKGETEEALICYRLAERNSENDYIKESSLLEISSMLTLIPENGNSLGESLSILNNLMNSNYLSIRISALTSLGYINTSLEHTRSLGFSQFEEALDLSVAEGLHRNVMQINLGLGAGHLRAGSLDKAIEFLNRSRIAREEIREIYGAQDIEADYHLYYLLAQAYRGQRKLEEAANSRRECVEIDRNYSISDRLATSLFLYGQDLCAIRNYAIAEEVFVECLDLVMTISPEEPSQASVVEWLAVAKWYLGKFEAAVEFILEFVFLNDEATLTGPRHIVTQQHNLQNRDIEERPNFVEVRGDLFHLLILPDEFSLEDVNRWNETVIKRRPELASSYNPILFSGKT
ncbi:MAG: ATP-binding protein [Anaerolineae bacterium]|nr:MAG: ATP-binding protein [Anaerolineae bacterium]